jgi:hypothetical protein
LYEPSGFMVLISTTGVPKYRIAGLVSWCMTGLSCRIARRV